MDHPVSAREPATPGNSVLSGITFIWIRTRKCSAPSRWTCSAVLLGGATALLPIYARDILHTGSWGLGVLRAAPAVGALLTSVDYRNDAAIDWEEFVCYKFILDYGSREQRLKCRPQPPYTQPQPCTHCAQHPSPRLR